MTTKQLAITTMATLLAAFALGAVAAPKGEGRDHQRPSLEIVAKDDNGRQHDNDNNGNNENSNRQSDPGSTRGRERAEERHEMNEKKHPQRTEHHWYNFFWDTDNTDKVKIKDKDKDKDKDENVRRWWWPF